MLNLSHKKLVIIFPFYVLRFTFYIYIYDKIKNLINLYESE